MNDMVNLLCVLIKISIIVNVFFSATESILGLNESKADKSYNL
jgi:hypothetical protein